MGEILFWQLSFYSEFQTLFDGMQFEGIQGICSL